MIARSWVFTILLASIAHYAAFAQLDPEKRRLVELGYNQPLEGRSPISGYGFYYYNQPDYPKTNMILRLAVAPVYLDSQLGFKGLLTPNTDLGVGIAGGGFADTYSEIRGGEYLREESFTGHAAEINTSIYHRLNPDWRVPATLVGRFSLHRSFYTRDDHTSDDFEIPDDLTSFNFRTGLRFGGREPSMTTPLALEASIWYEAHIREETQKYGYNNDREIERAPHAFLGRLLLKYTFEESQQYFDIGLTTGATIHADRLSSFRLGGMLPFISEFPLNIPGYYFQEISAEKFALFNAEYSFPITPQKNWRLTFSGAAAAVDYLDGQEQPQDWHAGVGGGIAYVSPRGAWFASLLYGYGFNAIRHDGEGANQIALFFQYDFEAVKKFRFRRFEPGVSPYSSKGGERLFR